MRLIPTLLANLFSPSGSFSVAKAPATTLAPVSKTAAPQGPTPQGAIPLPPEENPKPPKSQVSVPSYWKSATATTAVFPKVDINVANTDISSTFRLGATTPTVIRNLARVNADLSAAGHAYRRVGIPENFTVIARNPDGTFNRDATQLAMTIIDRMDKMPDFVNGFSQVNSLRSVAESLAKEILTEGAMSLELVLDQNFMPLRFQPVAVSQLFFYEDGDGTKPVQRLGGVDTDMDIPTFFYTALDADLLDVYPQSPWEAAVQPVLASSTFLSDLRKVCARHIYPRYDLAIDEEKLRARIPPEILQDNDKLNSYLNSVIADVQSTINGLGVEEALIHFDFFEVKYIEGGSNDTPNTFETVKTIHDAKIATGAKVMPSILGQGAASQNIASTETMIFLTSANGMIRLKLQELFSKAMTLAVRLFGLDVTVEFKYETINLRPELELEAFRAMKQSRTLELLSLGFLSDDEAAIELTGNLTPTGFAPLSGTGFFQAVVAAVPDQSNPNSTTQGNKQGALQQNLKPTSPTQPKGPAKKG